MDIRFTNENIFDIESKSIVYFTDNSLVGESSKPLIQRAGERIIEPLIKQQGCATGEVKIVPAFNLDAEYVIVSVLPDRDHPLAEKLLGQMIYDIFSILKEYEISSTAIDLYYIKKIFDQEYVAILNEIIMDIGRDNLDILLYLCKGEFIDKEA